MTLKLVIIGTAPTLDTSVVVGPFRSERAAAEAETQLTLRGYNTEICELSTLEQLPELPAEFDWENWRH